MRTQMDWVSFLLDCFWLPPAGRSRTAGKRSRLADWGDWGLFAFGLMMVLLAICAFLLPPFPKH